MSEPTNHIQRGEPAYAADTEASTSDGTFGTTDTTENEPVARKVPVGTLVFGLVLVAVGLILLAGILYGLTLDPGVVAVGIVVGAGLLLIVGGLVAGRRSAGTGT